MKYIEVDYIVVREGETILQDCYATVGLTDKNVKEVAEFIKDNHFSGELVDVPSHVFDRISRAVTDVAIRDMKSILKDVLYASDEVLMQEVLPRDLINLLPEEVVASIDMEKIENYYAQQQEEEVDEAEYLGFEWDIRPEEREDPTKENSLYLTIKQVYFDEIISGEKKEEYREIKDTTYKRYLRVDSNNDPIIYDEAIHDEAGVNEYGIYAWNEGEFPFCPKNIQYLDLAVGYNKERDTALVEVVGYSFNPAEMPEGEPMRYNITENGPQLDPEGKLCPWVMTFHLGKVIKCNRAKK